jgi:hypothetical protein
MNVDRSIIRRVWVRIDWTGLFLYGTTMILQDYDTMILLYYWTGQKINRSPSWDQGRNSSIRIQKCTE